MALVVKDRVQETTTTSGTGTLTLLGAVAGFQTFSTAIGNGNTTFYTIYDSIASVWEVGIGTVGTGTLARTTVLSNSSGNTSPITLAGNQVAVFCTYPAEKSVNLDSSGNVSPLGTIASGTWQGSTIGITYGGTAATTFTSNGILYGNGTSALGVTSAGTTGQVLVGNTGSAPSWTTLSSSAVTTFQTSLSGLTPSTATSGVVTLAGTLGTSSGGTNLTSFTSGGALYATSTSALTTGTLPVASGGTGVTTSTGSGNVVLSTSPTLVTPVLGTPTSGTLTNCTGYTTANLSGNINLTSQVTGTLPVINGGTGVTSSTGTGNVVLSASPTFTGTVVAPTINAGAATALTLQSAGTTAVTIDTSQNVGIGNTPSGTYKLQVSGLISDSKGDVRAAPINSQTSAYVLVASDAGKTISITTGGVTVNASVFSAGDMVSIFNNSGSSQTITQGTSVTLRLSGTATTGNRTLAQYGVATLLCVVGGATPTFACTGAGLT